MTTILIADDEPALRALVHATLEPVADEILEAADGAEAWQLIKTRRPDAVILDWQMPVFTGIELCAVLKGDPQLEHIPVILLTARTSAADKESGREAHATHYLTKPFDTQTLLALVSRVLDAGRSEDT